MSDTKAPGGDAGLELDWGDALEDWEQQLDQHALAESSPFPTRAGGEEPSDEPAAAAAPPPSERPSRPRPRMYQPPTEPAVLPAQPHKPASPTPESHKKTLPPPNPGAVAAALGRALRSGDGSELGAATSDAPSAPSAQPAQPTKAGVGSGREPSSAGEWTRRDASASWPLPTAHTLEVLLDSGESALEELHGAERARLLEVERAQSRTRITLLEALARKRRGARAAELLITAAELSERLGQASVAEQLYERALVESPRAANALGALARLAFCRGDVARYVQILERRAALPQSGAARARVLAELARARWLLERDLPAALGAATEAQRLAPEQLAPALLLARIEAAIDPARSDGVLLSLAARTQDRALAATFQVAAGRALELRGELSEARKQYARAAADDPFAFDAQLSLARTELALSAPAEAARALLRTLESFDLGPVADALRRRAAQLLASAGAYTEAVGLLEHASDDAALRTALQIALASGEPALKSRAAEAWALGSDGAERALALLTQAELSLAEEQPERAESALELAALADAKQPLVAVAREALARRTGNPTRLAQLAASEEAGRGALAAAAKLALSARNGAEELSWLLEAVEEQSGHAVYTLALDASAELGREDDLRQLLRAEAERGTSSARAYALLALAQLEREHGEAANELAALRRALELAPSDTALLRSYTRRPLPSAELVSALEREAELSQGARAAAAWLRAALARDSDPSARLAGLARAYDAEPGEGPAAWALHREARRQGDLTRLRALHESEASQARELRPRVTHLVRAALVRSGDDSVSAARDLTEALALAPEDPVLSELVVRLGDEAPQALLADTLERMAERSPAPFRRALLLAAAGALEDDGRGAVAAERYRALLLADPSDPIAEAGMERVALRGRSPAEQLALKLRAADDASTERARARALEELLLLGAEDVRREDWAHELLALVPSHPLALRAAEREALTRDDRSALGALEMRATQASRGPADRAARLRFVQLLRALEPEDESRMAEFNRVLLGCTAEAGQSSWLLRHLLNAAIAREAREPLLRALELLGQQSRDPLELASLGVQRAWLTLLEQPQSLEGALNDALNDALANDPDHPTALELLAEIKRALRAHEQAAELFEQAAERAQSAPRAAHLWMRAAELWDGELKRRDRAQRAYRHVLDRDIAHPGAAERMEALLLEQGDRAGLIALTSARITNTSSAPQVALLQRRLAELHEQAGDLTAAKEALRHALAHGPESLPAWRDLARVSERLHSHEERVEALLAVTRLSADPGELREALLELGEIYEAHLADRPRAIAAYQRVLKLGPRSARASQRLALLYRVESKPELAIETLTQLARTTSDEAQRREVSMQIATWREELGDGRAAEELLESLRRIAPTDLPVLRALTGLLRRSDAHAGLAMHLNRAANDLRQALAKEFDSPTLWAAIVEVLHERGRADVADQCTATARALGIELPELGPRAPEPEGIAAAALSELLDDLVFPERAPASLRILFRHAAEALERAAPRDLRALGAERLDKRHPLRALVAEQARWVGQREIEVYTSAELPYAFVPIQDAPVELLVGGRLLADSSPDEQRFLCARALKIARAHMSISCRLSPQELELLLHGLVRSQAPSHSPGFLDSSALDEAARRVGKHISRRAQGELMAPLLELTYAGIPRFDGARVYGVASIAGSRAGLLATGRVEPALSALVKLSGLKRASASPSEAVAHVEEASELVSFAISDAFFEARVRAGREAR